MLLDSMRLEWDFCQTLCGLSDGEKNFYGANFILRKLAEFIQNQRLLADKLRKIRAVVNNIFIFRHSIPAEFLPNCFHFSRPYVIYQKINTPCRNKSLKTRVSTKAVLGVYLTAKGSKFME